MRGCQCDSDNFFGMPSIEFGLKIDNYETNYAYVLKPKQFMTLPKVNPYLHNQMCALGLWNLLQVIPYTKENDL